MPGDGGSNTFGSSLAGLAGSIMGGLRSTLAAVVDAGGVGVEHPLKVRWRAATVKAINWVFIEEALQRKGKRRQRILNYAGWREFSGPTGVARQDFQPKKGS